MQRCGADFLHILNTDHGLVVCTAKGPNNFHIDPGEERCAAFDHVEHLCVVSGEALEGVLLDRAGAVRVNLTTGACKTKNLKNQEEH